MSQQQPLDEWVDEFTLQRLIEGNRRFQRGRGVRPHGDPEHRLAVAEAQHPFAMVVCCSDSREVPEIIFDCGLGDLFVVRSAGHVVGDTALASIEFGVVNLGVRVVVVLGHTACGAINATLAHHESIELGEQAPVPGHLPRLLAAIAPALTVGGSEPGAVTAAHVRRTTTAIRADLDTIDPGLSAGVGVYGAVYDLSTGAVDFLPAAGDSVALPE